MASWPNDKGFDNDFEQPKPVQLKVKGEIPRYAAGVLYRTGPMGYKVRTDKGNIWAANHWFDGLSSIHRFEIECSDDGPVQVTYSSRRTVDELLEAVKRTGKLDGITFGAKRDLCKSIFAKFFTMFTAPKTSANNIGVTVSVNMPGGGYIKSAEKPLVNGHSSDNPIVTLHAKSDSSLLKKINPETLEPEGIAMQSSLHPDLKGPFSAAHAKSDPETGDIYNFNLEFGLSPTYRIFCTSASTGETSILAKFTGTPAYIHSLFITQNYVVLCVWNSHVTWAGLSIPFHQNVVDGIAPFDKKKKAVWYAVDRRNGKGLVATYESDPFFCFHTVNAWEEPSASNPKKTDIIAELAAYENTDIIHRFYYDNLVSSSPASKKYAAGKKKRESCIPRHTQFRLPSVDAGVSPSKRLPAELLFQANPFTSMELPTINPAFLTKRHRYAYGNCDRLKSSFLDGIVKFDNVTQTAIFWEEEAHTPGEPIFIADPQGTAEDDGVLLSVVLDGIRGKSYLLCLDARDLSEKGRAELDGPVAFTFHGTHKRVGQVVAST
ncbi:beta,beta-carotene 9',10'-dioxygenase [Westerdykella ornata]|uniref:Beta,beta-carotene 9',10'-dioxygenase n=1 Tax=Westerdykella ornata TaxID=318751 RepID=A0A6A6J7K7_WESOR|nr:beta,beta-carotene 9',10'-dioxygenase [Westerdykella ornata]KAF2271636.1 beta,beta-carotene 9',10'-dioxygenase [Westerdykella ornata]